MPISAPVNGYMRCSSTITRAGSNGEGWRVLSEYISDDLDAIGRFVQVEFHQTHLAVLTIRIHHYGIRECM